MLKVSGRHAQLAVEQQLCKIRDDLLQDQRPHRSNNGCTRHISKCTFT